MVGDLPQFPLPQQASPWGAQKLRRWSTREDIGPQVNRKSDAQQLKDAAMEAIRLQGPLSESYTQMGPLVGTTTIVGQWRWSQRASSDKPVKGEVRRRRGRAIASAYEADMEGVKLALG